MVDTERKNFCTDSLPQTKEGCSEPGNPNGWMGLVAINFFPSTFGRKAESVKEAIERARQELTIPFKAVTISDSEYIVKNTPGLRVGKVRVMASKRRSEKNTLVVAAVPYSLSTTVKQASSNHSFRNSIQRHLEKHKLITTNIRMAEPKFVGVSVHARIRLSLKSQGLNDYVKRRISTSLDEFFYPFSASEPLTEDGGWDFGRNVYRSEIVALVESLPEVEDVLELKLGGIAPTGFHTDSSGNLIIDDLNLVYLENLSISIV
jgi:predicted phage baseplate assembly protein